MICNFGKRTGTDVLAGKIKNGFKIDVDDIRAICPDMIIQSNCPKPSKTKGRKSLRQLIANIIRKPWNYIKSRIEALIELKLTQLNQEIHTLKNRVETLEVNNPPANMIHRKNSWKSNPNI